ncbi:unnamed protein product, partial [Polarella glacialis]
VFAQFVLAGQVIRAACGKKREGVSINPATLNRSRRLNNNNDNNNSNNNDNSNNNNSNNNSSISSSSNSNNNNNNTVNNNNNNKNNNNNSNRRLKTPSLNAVPSQPPPFGRRLLLGGGEGVIKTDCALDVLQAATILGQVGLALSNAIMNRCPPKTVPEFLAKLISTDVVDLMNQMSIAGCALDVSSVISGVGWAILYFSLIAVHCVKTVDMRALCAAGISGVTSSLASVAAVGSGLFLACRAGPQKESLLEPLADSIRRLEGRASLEKRQQQQRQQQQQQQQQQPPEEQQQQQQQEQQRLDELIPELRQQQQQRQQQQGLDELTAELTLGLSHRAGDEEQHQRQQQQPQQQPQQQQRQQQQQQQQLDELFSAGDDPRAVWLQLGINLSDPKNRYNNSRNNNKNKSNSNINTSFLHNAPPALVGLEDIVSLLAAEVESQSSARESQRSAREVNNKNNNSNNNQVESQSSAREVNNNNNHYSSDDISNHNNHNNHNNNDNNNNIGLKLPTAPEKASVWWPRTCRR